MLCLHRLMLLQIVGIVNTQIQAAQLKAQAEEI